MPYKSMKQSKWMHAVKPEMAKEFDKAMKEEGASFEDLPEKSKKKPSKWRMLQNKKHEADPMDDMEDLMEKKGK